MFNIPNTVAGSIGSDPRDFGASTGGAAGTGGAAPDVPPDGAEPDGPSPGSAAFAART